MQSCSQISIWFGYCDHNPGSAPLSCAWKGLVHCITPLNPVKPLMQATRILAQFTMSQGIECSWQGNQKKWTSSILDEIMPAHEDSHVPACTRVTGFTSLQSVSHDSAGQHLGGLSPSHLNHNLHFNKIIYQHICTPLIRSREYLRTTLMYFSLIHKSPR